MDIDGTGPSAAFTGPFDNEVWGGVYDGVYLIKACALDKVVEYARLYGDGSVCSDPPPLPPPLSPPSLPPPPSPLPSNDVCSKDYMVAGCKCASQGFGHGLPDNPLVSTGLCCDKASKNTVKGAQITSWVTCVKYSPPPQLPPPTPPPPSPPPADVCSNGNFFKGCKKCGDIVGVNCPPVSTGLCCHNATKVAVKAEPYVTMFSSWHFLASFMPVGYCKSTSSGTNGSTGNKYLGEALRHGNTRIVEQVVWFLGQSADPRQQDVECHHRHRRRRQAAVR